MRHLIRYCLSPVLLLGLLVMQTSLLSGQPPQAPDRQPPAHAQPQPQPHPEPHPANEAERKAHGDGR